MDYAFHSLAALLPMMSEEKYSELKHDIERKGLEHPIVLFEGKILDGRNRYTACIDAGKEPVFVEYKGSDPLGFVLSMNVHRRQLTPAQASVAAAKVANISHGGDRKSNRTANLPLDISVDQAASMFGISEKNVRKAKSFIETAHPDLVELVQTPGSKVSLDAACLVATRPQSEQLEILAEGPKAVKKAAADIRNPPPDLSTPHQEGLDLGGPWSISNIKTGIQGYIKAFGRSAHKDPDAVSHLDEIIAECLKLKGELLSKGELK